MPSLEKYWQVQPEMPEKMIKEFPEIDPIILQLLYNRGIISQDQVDHFLTPEYGQDLYDPFLLLDMAKAVIRTLQAVEQKEKIVVYGDYDADGVTSSVVMVEALKALGADVDVYIPFRETEGYGLNADAATELVNKKIKLVITVDCGISNISEIEILTKGGVDVIVTDHHHEPPKLPEAFALINPHLSREKYPYKFLAGVGVAFKFVSGLVREHKQYKVNQLPDGWEKWLLDLVAIGTIADLQPLNGENRVLTKYGLIVMQKTKRIGLLKMIESMKSKLTQIDERVVGWQVCPRLNAAGRLNHASSAYQLLITDEMPVAEKYTEELNLTNRERQTITDKIMTQAKEYLGVVNEQKILIAIGDNWPTGVVGLVSGRLTDQFYRPSLIISRFNGEIIGSGRSIGAFNIIEALEANSQYLKRYGGHAQACGFTLKDEENLQEFIKAMIVLAEKQLAGKELVPELKIDMVVNLEDVTWKLFEDLEKFPPYGEGNPKPRFLAQNLTITGKNQLGSDGQHLRLMVKHRTEAIKKTIGFCFGEWCAKINSGDKIDLVFEVDLNEYNGNRELQLKIVDLKLS